MMKFMKWKSLFITCGVCLLAIIPGIVMWNRLPDAVAIHFDVNNNPDNFVSKGFAVFGLPLLMVVLQCFCCFINDINAHKHGERKKFELVTKWIIPVMAVVLQLLTLGYAVGWNVDMRKAAAVIVGVILIVIGNYIPKFDYIKNHDMDTQKARKIHRFIGFETVVMGLLFLGSIFLPPIATVVCLILLVPYAVIGIIYGIKVGRRKDTL